MKLWNMLSILFLLSFDLNAQFAFEQEIGVPDKHVEHVAITQSPDGNIFVIANQFENNIIEKGLIFQLNKYGNVVSSTEFSQANFEQLESIDIEDNFIYLGGCTDQANPVFQTKLDLASNAEIWSQYNNSQYTGSEIRQYSYAQFIDDDSSIFFAQTGLTNVETEEHLIVGLSDSNGNNVWSSLLFLNNESLIVQSLDFINDQLHVLAVVEENGNNSLGHFIFDENGSLIDTKKLTWMHSFSNAQIKTVSSNEVYIIANSENASLISKLNQNSVLWSKEFAINNTNGIGLNGIELASSEIILSGFCDFNFDGDPSSFILTLDENGNIMEDAVYAEVSREYGNRSLIKTIDAGNAFVMTKLNGSGFKELYIVKTNELLETACESSGAFSNLISNTSINYEPSSVMVVNGITQEPYSPNIVSNASITSKAIPILDLGQDRSACADTVILDAKQFGFTEFLWQDGAITPQYIVQESGSYSVEIRSDFDCIIQRDTVEISIDKKPEIDFTSDTLTACLSGIEISPDLLDGDLIWQDGSTDSLFLVETEGLYFASAINDCGEEMDSIFIEIESQPIDLGEDFTAEVGDTINFDFSELSSVEFFWSPASLSCIDCNVTELVIEETTEIIAEASFSTGCVVSDTLLVTIEAENEIILPSGFTPNGDGVNDDFIVQANFENEYIESVQVYNRWGKKVADFGGGEVWSGRDFEDTALPIGVYPVVTILVKADGSKKLINSSLTLVR